MSNVLDPFRFVLIAVAGGMNQRQLHAKIGFSVSNLAERRLRLSDHQRRRLAAKAKAVGQKLLAEVATIVTPETLMAWHQKLICKEVRRYDEAVTATNSPTGKRS
jgi:hypothetical protein